MGLPLKGEPCDDPAHHHLLFTALIHRGDGDPPVLQDTALICIHISIADISRDNPGGVLTDLLIDLQLFYG